MHRKIPFAILALWLPAFSGIAGTGDILGLQVRTATGAKPLTITAPTAGQVLKFSGTPATPLSVGTLSTADITGLQTALDLKANANNPVLTGSGTFGTMSGNSLGVDTEFTINPLTQVEIDSTDFIYGAGSAAAHRTALGLGTLATQSGTFSGTSSGTNTGDQTLSDATISTSDITTNNATTAKHGFLKKLSNTATEYMDGTGSWSTPPGGTAANPTASVGLTAVNGAASTYLRSDGAPALDQTISPTWTGAHTIKNDALGTTTAARLSLTNTTAAAAGAQQITPSIDLSSFGWKTTATAASQECRWRLNSLPVQGSANPSANFQLQFGVNGATPANVMTVSSSGQVLATNYALNGGDGSGLAFNTWTTLVGQSFGVRIGNGTNHQLQVGTNALTMPVGSKLIWTDNTVTTTAQTWFGQKAAANLQQGAADASTAVAQTSSVQSVIAGTSNTAGADRTYTGSQGTGTGNGGSLLFQTAPPGATGTAQNALSTRQYVYGGEKTLTESSATPILSIALGTSKYLGGQLIVTTHADDGTDFQATTEHFTFAAVNKAGAVTTSIQAAPSSSTTAASAGTLTTAWTIGATGAQVEIKNNAGSSLTQTTLKCSYQLIMNGDGTNVVTP